MERFDMEELYQKVGGIFRLTVLVQKRLKQLNSGARPLVKAESKNLKDTVYKEILEGKIQLVADESDVVEVQERKATDAVKDMFSKAKSNNFKLPSLK
ncbi:DNA-directed RNA polymerase subunit omega [Candidatus Uabimicrobium sp. HlEnr_7]|uniref:DNA-directed RNA polymerase subunit omega n=1 Tax=Candidatus Uabimicrobium helgolandensis TaxID=3095367 RepID=UPI003558FA4C